MTETTERTEDAERRRRELAGAERLIRVALTISILAGVGLFVVYFQGGQTQVEGVLFLLALGGLGVAIIAWGSHLLEAHEAVEERHELASGAEAAKALGVAFAEESGPALRRRSFLVRLLAAAGGALGLSLLLPILSLGPAPGRTLKETPWRRGTRVVTEEGELVRADELPVDGVLTVYPENHLDAADAQALLIRVPPEQLELPADRRAAAPDGNLCYSKICTHAGCPVGLYRTENKSLFCPCHQSQFDVLRGAVPVFGPAARPLPQLPLEVDEEGYLVAMGDFYEPVGPAFWDRRKS